MTKYFYDCEFYENGFTIDLISIGFVAEDGRELYLINADFDLGRYDEDTETAHWLTDNVVPHLPLRRNRYEEWEWEWDTGTPEYCNRVFSRVAIRAAIRSFMRASKGLPELWANYGAYDHVSLMQIFGQMMERDPILPMYTNDLQQLLRSHVINPASMPQQAPGEQHDALADARHLKACHEQAMGIINGRRAMLGP